MRSLVLAILLLSVPAQADPSPRKLPIPVTLIDLPEAVVLPQHAPTWRQSLDLTGGLFRAAHLGVHLGFSRLSTAWWSVMLETMTVAALDVAFALVPVPFLQGWVHEEGHRAAMGVVGLPSRQFFNNVFATAAERCDEGSVCGMTDRQIATVRDRRPADWVRVQAAGMETELELGRGLLRDAFFFEQPRGLNMPAAWLAYASVEVYRHACAERGGFDETLITAESPRQLERDFTGPDCTGWVADLHRPAEPYLARPPHPNGDGVRRARLSSDLTDDERSHLIRMRNLGFLNFVDPALFAFPRFTVKTSSGRRVDFTASLQHDLTAFGDALGLQAMVHTGRFNLLGVARVYRNQALALPGLLVGVRRFPVRLGGLRAHANATVELWVQPRDFSFQTTLARGGAALEADLAAPMGRHLEVFVGVRAKSEGWRPVDPYLDPAFSVRLGVNVLMPLR